MKNYLFKILVILLFSMKIMQSIKVEAASETLQNPKIVEDTTLTSGQKVTWDCIWFGSYPQSEVTSTEEVYAKLQAAADSEWNSNNDITIDGIKYRRLQKSDATYAVSTSSNYYTWESQVTYHYFKYDPIKWRVLENENGQALLLSDIVLDDQRYNITSLASTWQSCTIRSWLNGYDKEVSGIDYSSKNFIDTAFSDLEKDTIITSTVINADNLIYGTEAGEDTTDKIFLLSESEVYSTDQASNYGFLKDKDAYDNARRMQSSTYAKAMGTYSNQDSEYLNNCTWWLRSPGSTTGYASYILTKGCLYEGGFSTDYEVVGVCPALYLNLSSTDLYSYAGTVSSDGTKDETAYAGDYNVTYDANAGNDLVSNMPFSQIKVDGVSLKLSTTVPTRENYIFAGWAKSTSATAAEYQPGDSYDSNEDIILYAVWNLKKYKLNYNLAGGSATIAAQEAPYGNTIILSNTVPVKEGYDFQGWFDQDSGIAYQAGDEYRMIGDTTLYAVWTVKTTESTEQITTNPNNTNTDTNATSDTSMNTGTNTITTVKQPQTITASSRSVAYKSKPFSLKAKASGGGKLTYKSSNKKVATVSSAGKVTVKNYGQATITITAAANGNFQAATKKITIKVVPKKMTLKKANSPAKKQLKITWTKNKTVTGYHMNISLRKDFKRGTIERFYKASKSSVNINGFKSKKTYYVRFRAYKKVGNKKYYGPWSNVKKVKIK
ncbi:MAG: DUF6273 domain-containing protein [Lachnospiraceae bacterium]|nr:DUF6273 domain-containing protein [Lachnospiraceae bacterium]